MLKAIRYSRIAIFALLISIIALTATAAPGLIDACQNMSSFFVSSPAGIQYFAGPNTATFEAGDVLTWNLKTGANPGDLYVMTWVIIFNPAIIYNNKQVYNAGGGLNRTFTNSGTFTIPATGIYSFNFVTSNNNNAGFSAVVNCKRGGATSPASPSETLAGPPDDRINYQYGDLSTVIYATSDGFAVYCYHNGATSLALFGNEEIVNAADVHENQSTPLFEHNENDCHFAFYILDTGEYQINIWTDGKLYEIIADNLEFAGATRRYVDFGE